MDEREMAKALDWGRRVVALQLEAKFGKLSDKTRRRIAKANLFALEAWAVDVLKASSIEELFFVEDNVDQIMEHLHLNSTRQYLLRALKRQFGEVPESFCRRIADAGSADLEQWFDRLILAPTTLDEVFAPA